MTLALDTPQPDEEHVVQTAEMAIAPIPESSPLAEPEALPEPVAITPEAMPTTDEIDFDLSAEPADDNAPTPTAKVENYLQEAPWSSQGETDFNIENDTAFLPGATLETTKQKLTDLPNQKLSTDAATQDWFTIVQGGMTAIPFGDGLKITAERPEATWRQQVPSTIGPLRAGVPPFRPKSGERPSGESARMHIRATMKMGTVFVAPLWHSGFWVTLKAPTERDLLELYRLINADKTSLGRSTYGFIYSNGTSYTTRVMVDFIVDHLHETSLNLPDGADIRDFIRMPDLQTLIWALACACWPGGFQYQRSCVDNPEKCNYVVKERLNLSKLLWADTSALTEWQTTHMTKRTRNSVTVENQKRYVAEFIRGQNQLVEINSSLSMILKVPTVNEHIQAGYRWINQIEEMYARVLIQDERERDDYLIKQGKATAMRQYAHLVQQINAESYEYDETTTIEEALDDLTSNDKVRDLFLQRAREYLEKSVITLVAIPTFTCPKCGNDHSKVAHPKHQELIALDVQQSFFQLLVQKLQKIENR